jgi:hypothetical protein
MKHILRGSRILFEAIHAVWSAASKVLTGQTCHELLETFVLFKVTGHNVKSLALHVHLIPSSKPLLHLEASPLLFLVASDNAKGMKLYMRVEDKHDESLPGPPVSVPGMYF